MKTYTERLSAALDYELAGISGGSNLLLEKQRAAILVCKKAMAKLKNYIAGYDFADTAGEICFFKVIKPQFYSKYIYFISVYNFLVQRPAGSSEIQQDYIRMHLDELKTFFDHNRTFYAYYRGAMTQLDENLFHPRRL